MLQDAIGRNIRYLRISVTDRCNFRCRYCMPPEGVPWIPHEAILRYEEMLRIVKACAKLGVEKIRITGGEPLLRKGILSFIRQVRATPGIQEVSLTTNGSLLEEYAPLLKEAGINRINISLDTMNPARFQALTGQAALNKVLAGIARAEAVGMFPIKINMVVMKGINDDEVPQFAAWTKEKAYEIRFIEYMPFGQGENYLVTTQELKDKLTHAGYVLLPAEGKNSSHVSHFRLAEGKGKLGFISPLSQHFCDSCNRIRLTAEGYIKLCLFSNEDVLLRERLRSGIREEELEKLLQQLVWDKPQGHHLAQGETCERAMSRIGG